MSVALGLWNDAALVPPSALLEAQHYLGPSARSRLTYQDSLGVMQFANPASRNLPQRRWLELTRWCLVGPRNSGSRQWSLAVPWLRARAPSVTTIVSYSDPSVGHTGALYRACNWLWAPTWMRLQPPPSGVGAWKTGGKNGPVKDRWVYLLSPDDEREAILKVSYPAVMRRMPWASYREPRWRHGRPDPRTGGGDWNRWQSERAAVAV